MTPLIPAPRWYSPAGSTNVTSPTFGVVTGTVNAPRRVQFGFSVPYYHANEPGGPIARGLGVGPVK